MLQIVPQTPEPASSGGISHPETMSLTSEPEMGYFNMYSKEMLVQAIKNCMKEVILSYIFIVVFVVYLNINL